MFDVENLEEWSRIGGRSAPTLGLGWWLRQRFDRKSVTSVDGVHASGRDRGGTGKGCKRRQMPCAPEATKKSAWFFELPT
jgi:hypothetical protein